MAATTTTATFSPSSWAPHHHRHHLSSRPNPHLTFAPPRAFRRSDLDDFARRLRSGDALRDALRSANRGLETLLFESRVAAQRLDRRYSISRRLADAGQVATERAREIDLELGIGRRWRAFSADFVRNLPRYRKKTGLFLESPLGKTSSTIFFLWFALSGWLFRILLLATWVLPLAAPLAISLIANNLVIQGACPACRKQFVGYKNQVIRCANCRNIVWQPKEDFPRGRGGGARSSSSEPDIIDVEIEEK